MGPLPRLFLHYFDLHFLEAASRNRDPAQIVGELRLATRLAILVADEVIVPAASYFESPLCAKILDELSSLFPTGTIRLVGGDPSVQDFIRSKLSTYDEGGRQHLAYQAAAASEALFPPFMLRRRSSTHDITAAWLDRSEAPGFLEEQFGTSISLVPGGFLEKWRTVPEVLGGRAFTPEYAAQHIADGLLAAEITAKVHGFINDEYFRSFSREFAAGFVTDLILLSSPHDLDDRYGNIHFSRARRALQIAGLLERVMTCDAQALLDLKGTQQVAMAVLPCIVATTQMSQLHGTAKLDVQVDLSPAIAALRAVEPGGNTATKYQKQVTAILDQVFAHSLLTGELEYPVNNKRKRIDVKWVNTGEGSLFSWIHRSFRAPIILGECKNYSDDVANPEVDQLAGRFAPYRSEFGFLLCRKVENKALLLERCRDIARAQRGIIVVLDDDNVEDLATMSHEGGWDDPQAIYLLKLIDDVRN
ncbi:hypothetical protein [Microbacterium sp. WCS2018Hpa-9]|uniref:hypothetical protein n=1 Tax=Microbacterium sp. WCS2018Hpa-9 TaxID=3073635 RepID=UPI00288AFB96|nr:hypothetical protein [Microbacterium sp. WCS2018Hpa-9]